MRRGRRWLLPGAAVAVVALVVALLLRPDPEDTPARPAEMDTPTRYSVTYRVEDHNVQPPRISTSVVEVDRPYRARVRQFDGEDTDAPLLGGSIWTEAGVYTITRGGGVQPVQPVPPGRPGADVRLDVALPFALETERVLAGDEDEVAGRQCRVYRSAGPLDGVVFAPPLADEVATSCVDAVGLILHEEWRFDDVLAQRRIAQEVGDGVALTDDVLFGGDPPPIPQGIALARVTSIDAPATRDVAVRLPAELAGLPVDRAVRVLEADPTEDAFAPARRRVRTTYTDGAVLLVVDQIEVLTGPPAALPEGRAIRIDGLGEGVVAASFDGVVIAVRLDARTTLEVRGAVDPDRLLDALERLQ